MSAEDARLAHVEVLFRYPSMLVGHLQPGASTEKVIESLLDLAKHSYWLKQMGDGIRRLGVIVLAQDHKQIERLLGERRPSWCPSFVENSKDSHWLDVMLGCMATYGSYAEERYLSRRTGEAWSWQRLVFSSMCLCWGDTTDVWGSTDFACANVLEVARQSGNDHQLLDILTRLAEDLWVTSVPCMIPYRFVWRVFLAQIQEQEVDVDSYLTSRQTMMSDAQEAADCTPGWLDWFSEESRFRCDYDNFIEAAGNKANWKEVHQLLLKTCDRISRAGQAQEGGNNGRK